jgi:hypothetical protein
MIAFYHYYMVVHNLIYFEKNLVHLAMYGEK